MSTQSISAARVRELLAYDPTTGIFTWLITSGRSRRRYRAHRLAWLHMHGEWPTNDIDHLNGNRSDNRIENLRDVPRSVNTQNQRQGRSDNLCGFLGVSPSGKRWRATIQLNGKKAHLGTFNTPKEAHSAYLAAKRQLHPGNTL